MSASYAPAHNSVDWTEIPSIALRQPGLPFAATAKLTMDHRLSR
jgi:hypothetical protein